jgi:hypothetical protein
MLSDITSAKINIFYYNTYIASRHVKEDGALRLAHPMPSSATSNSYNLVGWSSSYALYVCFGGSRFESRSGHRLF